MPITYLDQLSIVSPGTGSGIRLVSSTGRAISVNIADATQQTYTIVMPPTAPSAAGQTLNANVDGTLYWGGGFDTTKAITLTNTTTVPNTAIATGSLTGALTIGGDLVLGATNPMVFFPSSGVGPPTFTTRSIGSKLVLVPAVGANSGDYAIGVDANTVWNALPANTASYSWKWYGGTTNVLSLDGTGSMVVAGTVTSSTAPSVAGNLTNKAYVDGISYINAGTGLTKTGSTLAVNAAQPSITSVGTLASLAVGNAVSINGGSTAYGKLAIQGAPNAGGSGGNLSMTTSDDPNNPTIQLLNYAHNNIGILFDAAFGADWFSTYAGSSASIYKSGNNLSLNWGVAAVGVNPILTPALQINLTNGVVSFPTTASSISATGGNALQVSGGAAINKSIYLGNATTNALLVLGGAEKFQPGTGTSTTAGVALTCGVNRTGNRQLWIGDSANFAASTTAYALRVTVGGTTRPILGGVTTDGLTTTPLECASQWIISDASTSALQVAGGALVSGALSVTGVLTAGGTLSTGCHSFLANAVSADTISLQGLNAAGYSSLKCLDNSGTYMMSFGYANTGAASFAGSVFLNTGKTFAISSPSVTTSGTLSVAGTLTGSSITASTITASSAVNVTNPIATSAANLVNITGNGTNYVQVNLTNTSVTNAGFSFAVTGSSTSATFVGVGGCYVWSNILTNFCFGWKSSGETVIPITTQVAANVNLATSTGGALNVGGDVVLGATNPRIYFPSNGLGAPTYTNRSIGSKLVLWSGVSATAADYAIGIEGSNMWFSVPNSPQGFNFYGGTILLANLTGSGFSVNSTSAGPSVPLSIANTGLATGSFSCLQIGVSGENNQSARLYFNYAGSGSTANTLGLGLLGSPTGVLIDGLGRTSIGSNASGTVVTTSGQFLNVKPATFTDSGSAAAGTVSAFIANYFGQATIAATNTGITTTSASTLFIAGPPIAGSNETITKAYALNVASGNSILAGSLTVGSNTGTTALNAVGSGIVAAIVNGISGNSQTSFTLTNSVNGTTGYLGLDGNGLQAFTQDALTLFVNNNKPIQLLTSVNVQINAPIILTNQINYAPPTFSTRSIGAKLVLYPSLSATATDYALGVEGGYMWLSAPTTTTGFKWYGGTTTAMTLSGSGNLAAVGDISCVNATLTGSFTVSSATDYYSTSSTSALYVAGGIRTGKSLFVSLSTNIATLPVYTASNFLDGAVMRTFADPNNLLLDGTWNRYLDIAALGASNGSVGGSVIRFLTNPNASGTAVERMRIRNDGTVSISQSLNVAANILAGAGSVGFTMLLTFTYNDVAVGSSLQLNEPGNPGFNGGLYYGPTFNPRGHPDESLTWNRIRFIFRAVALNGSMGGGSNTQFQIQQQNYNYGVTNVGSQFGGLDGGAQRGYVTYVSPWLSGFDISQYWIVVVSASTTVRIGPTYVQFAY